MKKKTEKQTPQENWNSTEENHDIALNGNGEDWLSHCRRKLHACAEVGFDLSRTREAILHYLEVWGVEHKRVGNGSIVARIGRGDAGVLLRADMDALPLQEETTLPFRSQNGCMHACGHDMHTAMLLGAIRNLSKREEKPQREIRFLFQASEENLCGAMDVISCGVLDEWDKIKGEKQQECKQELEIKCDYYIKKAFSVHCMTSVPLRTGTIIIPGGGIGAAASSFFEVKVKGESSHSGTPHIGRDALRCINALYEGYLTLPQSTLSVTDLPLLTIGELHAGSAPNVTPSDALFKGTVRTMTDAANQTLLLRMEKLAENYAKAHEVKCHFTITGNAPTLLNDPELSTKVLSLFKDCFGEEQVLSATSLEGSDGQKKSGGSEDFAHFSHRVPSLLVAICAGDSREGFVHPLHHPKVLFDEKALPVGSLVYELLATMS